MNGAGVPRVRYKPGFKTAYQLRSEKSWETRRKNGNDTGEDAGKGIPCPQRSRYGVPHGMRKKEAHRLRDEARKTAEEFMDEQYKDELIVPGSDEEKGKAALTELTVIALAPGDVKTKVAAARAVLEWTKAKPATKVDAKVSSAEAWLAAVIADAKSE